MTLACQYVLDRELFRAVSSIAGEASKQRGRPSSARRPASGSWTAPGSATRLKKNLTAREGPSLPIGAGSHHLEEFGSRKHRFPTNFLRAIISAGDSARTGMLTADLLDAFSGHAPGLPATMRIFPKGIPWPGEFMVDITIAERR
ncbi:hypothetical protein [Streptomyces sp. PAN_FS17]|uniref:hypothetical protein n=1 Tax=Streptomyces TaxID=1883 RepID=UPI00115F90F3|nr:hypothetical protein [Streptomyces sp. PAN_FS17]